MKEAKRFLRPGSKSTKEFILAKTMMAIVLVFLILNIPRLILGIMEVVEIGTVEVCYELGLDYDVGKHIYIFDFMARFLVILNSSINFIVYCLVGSEFREQLRRGLGLCRREGDVSMEMTEIESRVTGITVIKEEES